MRHCFLLTAFMLVYLMVTPVVAGSSHSGQYLLDVGDRISINVLGGDSLTMKETLDSTGMIRYPFLGRIRVVGKTTSEVESMIRNGLAGDYLVDPHVEVVIDERRPFFINGEVNKPGAISYQENLTLRKAITLASGLSELADDDRIFVIRAGDPNRVQRKLAMDDPIYPGDSITVETSYFFITGEVKSRGKYPYHTGLTFRMAVTLAGGFAERADKDDIEVVRVENGKSREMSVRLDDPIKPRDVITVNQSFF